MSWARPLLLTILAACGKQDPDSDPPVVSKEPLEQLQQLASDAGWTVQPGAISTATMEHCCEPLVHCLSVDPAAPYQAYALPPAPEQTLSDPDLYWMWSDIDPGLTRDFRLRPDEALVWIGTLPSEVPYFALRTLLSTRPDSTGSRQRVLGAMGPPLDGEAIAAERGVELDALWGSPLIAITAADAAIEEHVRGWLESAGFDGSVVHADRIAGQSARMGLAPEDDSFVTLIQTLDPDADPAVAAWREDPGLVLRLTPPGEPQSPDAFAQPKLGDRGTGVYEDGYADALEELRLALRDHWPTRQAFPGLVAWDWHQTFACAVELDCNGDTHDRLRASSIPLTLEPDSFAVAYGVNHVATGKARHSTLAVHRQLTGSGVGFATGAQLVGSARPWLGDSHPQVDELYAVVVSRDCSGFASACIEVPSTCPGPLPGEELSLTWSLYEEPQTGVAPLQAELTLDRVTKFFPEPG